MQYYSFYNREYATECVGTYSEKVHCKYIWNFTGLIIVLVEYVQTIIGSVSGYLYNRYSYVPDLLVCQIYMSSLGASYILNSRLFLRIRNLNLIMAFVDCIPTILWVLDIISIPQFLHWGSDTPDNLPIRLYPVRGLERTLLSEILLSFSKQFILKWPQFALRHVDKRVLMEGYLRNGFGSLQASDRV